MEAGAIEEDLRSAIAEIRRLQKARGTKEKLAIIAENKENFAFKRLLYYACHPLLSYKVSETTLSRNVPLHNPVNIFVFSSIFEVCETLSKKKALDEATIHLVLLFLAAQKKDYRELFKKLLAKTLRLGVTAKSINKVIPGLIPEWEVQQAYPIEKYPLKEGTWFALTQKLNGVRCTYYRGRLVGRSGAPFEGLDHIVDELSNWPDLVFDGELTLKDKDGLSDNEAFRTATGIINSDDGDKSRICFTIFDMLHANEFDNGQSNPNYSMRRELLVGLQNALSARAAKNVSVLPVLYMGTDQSQIDIWLDRMVKEDKEGLMVNLNVPYRCKRHSGILKVKRFYTMDLPIIRCKEGKGKYQGTTGSIIVDYKGNEVGVGGLNDAQRQWFWEHRNEIAGMLIEVKYKELSYDKKNGNESFQFPEFVRIREDKNEVSYG